MKLHVSQLTGLLATFDEHVERGPGVVTFKFKPTDFAQWEAGQYYVYALPQALLDKRTALRPFTVSTAPHEGNLEFTTRLPQSPSLFKQHAMLLKSGAKVYTAGPFGFFTFRETTGPSVFLAGGIGITAFRSILVDLASRGPLPDITLLYANRNTDILFKSDLDALAKMHPRFKVVYLIDPHRLDTATIKQHIPDTAAAQWYVSGPKPMVTGLGATLKNELNVPSDQIHHDSFKGYPWPLN